MKIIDLSTYKETTLSRGTSLSCAIGNFDGVHIGHAKLLYEAASKPQKATNSAVWTFSAPPANVFGKNVKVLTDISEKLKLFASFGIEYAIIEDFENVKELSASEFVSQKLINELNVHHVVCGFNFRFGKGAAGDAAILGDLMSKQGAYCSVVPKVSVDGVTVSSSNIRKYISDGNMDAANAMLGRPYQMALPVVHGKHLGSKMGFPTANQAMPDYVVTPKFGVYATKCIIDGKEYVSVSNIGVRPSFDDGDKVNIETHVIGFCGDLYGKTVRVMFYGFLRPEIKFSSVPDLEEQVEKDKKQAIEFFNNRR
ncbi:MAG: bifunctional riboflavin kinase/FAD synthetase [Clostridia bacterium]|nr:bifunctional riboflavin kinase/FAD synthetase [Clostridia bacterium]